MIGGEEGFGPGGYGGTPVETLMPVLMKIPGGGRTEGLELIFLLDKSGSMDEKAETRTKWDRAVEAAASALEVLRKGDALGVIAFDAQAREILPLRRDPDPAEVGRRLREIVPGGGTEIAEGLEKALNLFSASGAGSTVGSRRHLILLSDGKTGRTDFPAFIRRLKQAGISVSVIAVGEDPDARILKVLTTETGGRFYPVGNGDLSAGALEALFLRDTLAASERWFVTEAFHPRLRDPVDGVETPLLSHQGRFPLLGGYVRTTAKGTSRVLLESDRGDPIVAAWHYGAGRAAAVTTDAAGRWSGTWLNWPPFLDAFGNLVRWTLAPTNADPRGAGREAWERTSLLEAREKIGMGPDYLILKRLTGMTGGRFLRPEDNPFLPETGENGSGNFWTLYLSAILILFLLDVGYHRWSGSFSGTRRDEIRQI
ncbi:MAG: VWA domain-containing protein [Nitrospirae bacterium]|nr:VWA domain-containing protein [Nitrospirota bacterium]